MQITIYTTPTCHFCHMAKEFFNEHKIEYTEKDVAKNIEARKEMIGKTEQLGVPVIDIGGKIIIGFDRNALSDALGL